MGKLKKIGIGFGILVLGFFALMIITAITFWDEVYDAAEQELQGSNVEISEKPIISTKNVEDMIPIREDVGTTWRISDSGLTLSGYSKWEGITGVIGKTYRSGSSNLQEITVNILKFDAPDNTKMNFDSIVAKNIKKGGYEEVNINAHDAQCYGMKLSGGSYSSYESFQYRCIKGNIYVYVNAASVSSGSKGNAGDFMRMTLDKIN